MFVFIFFPALFWKESFSKIFVSKSAREVDKLSHIVKYENKYLRSVQTRGGGGGGRRKENGRNNGGGNH
jgi:hypothetical protein